MTKNFDVDPMFVDPTKNFDVDPMFVDPTIDMTPNFGVDLNLQAISEDFAALDMTKGIQQAFAIDVGSTPSSRSARKPLSPRSQKRKEKALGHGQSAMRAKSKLFGQVSKGYMGVHHTVATRNVEDDAEDLIPPEERKSRLAVNLPPGMKPKSPKELAATEKLALTRALSGAMERVSAVGHDDNDDLSGQIMWARVQGLPEDDPNLQAAVGFEKDLHDRVKHPTRAEILLLEPADHEDILDLSASDLKELSSKGRTKQLLDSMHGYLGDKHLTVKSQCWVNKLWTAIDINNDGTLSAGEAQELLRCYLSRPALGEVLSKEVVKSFSQKDLEKSPGDTGIEALQILGARAVAEACRSMAKDIPKVTKDLWLHMDIDHSGTITGDEFMKSFPGACAKYVEAPLVQMAKPIAHTMLKAGAQVAKTPDDATKVVKAWKKEQKRKEEEKRRAEEEEEKRKAKWWKMW